MQSKYRLEKECGFWTQMIFCTCFSCFFFVCVFFSFFFTMKQACSDVQKNYLPALWQWRLCYGQHRLFCHLIPITHRFTHRREKKMSYMTPKQNGIISNKCRNENKTKMKIGWHIDCELKGNDGLIGLLPMGGWIHCTFSWRDKAFLFFFIYIFKRLKAIERMNEKKGAC